jgi:hypothetical protein
MRVIVPKVRAAQDHRPAPRRARRDQARLRRAPRANGGTRRLLLRVDNGGAPYTPHRLSRAGALGGLAPRFFRFLGAKECARFVCGDEQIDAAAIKGLFAFASDADGRSAAAAHADHEAYSRRVMESDVEFNGQYDRRDAQIVHLFSWLDNLDKSMLTRFLRFLTGHNSIPPPDPARPFRLLVDGKTLTELSALPTVSTCYNLLHLPPYETFTILEDKLTKAVQMAATAGFELH